MSVNVTGMAPRICMGDCRCDQTLIQPKLPDDAPPGHGDGGSRVAHAGPDELSGLAGRGFHVERAS